jgi:hypothetical protein
MSRRDTEIRKHQSVESEGILKSANDENTIIDRNESFHTEVDKKDTEEEEKGEDLPAENK